MKESLPTSTSCEESQNWQSRLVLIVEDSDDDYFLLTRAFRKANFFNPIRRVENGKEAIRYLEAAGPFADRVAFPFPYVVLLDLKMPGLHGFDVLDWARQHEETRLLPMVVFTSSQLDVDVRESYLRGANGFIMKSTSLTSLTDVVAAIHAYWVKINHVQDRA